MRHWLCLPSKRIRPTRDRSRSWWNRSACGSRANTFGKSESREDPLWGINLLDVSSRPLSWFEAGATGGWHRMQTGTPHPRRALLEWLALMALWAVVVAAPIIAFDRFPAEDRNVIGETLGMTGVLFIPPIIAIVWAFFVGLRMTNLLQSRVWGTASLLVGLALGSMMILVPDGHPGHMSWIASDTAEGWACCFSGVLVVLLAGLAGVFKSAFALRSRPGPTSVAVSPQPPATAAYCTGCQTYVWVRADGSCERGHPASMLSGHYLAYRTPR